jgi:hypothetical protein
LHAGAFHAVLELASHQVSSFGVLVVAEAPLEEGEKLLHRSKPLAFARVDFFHATLELTADRLGFLSEAKDEGSFHNE